MNRGIGAVVRVLWFIAEESENAPAMLDTRNRLGASVRYGVETFRRMLQLLQLERPAVRQIPAGSQQECQAPSLVMRGAHSGHVRQASEQGRRGPLER
jgi:hypothetical protein